MSNKVGQLKKMDRTRSADKEILRTAIKTAQRHGLAIDLIKSPSPTAQHQADGLARVRQGNQETLYLVECKRNVRTATLGVTLHRMERLASRRFWSRITLRPTWPTG
jgi:hypothetical protein